MNAFAAGLTIKVVAERTGVSVQTLRAWERRYGVPHPSRMPGSRYRVYTDEDIADVAWMKQQIASGVSPAQAGLLLRLQRRAKTKESVAPGLPIAVMLHAYQNAALESDVTAARQILDESFALFAPEDVGLQIIQPAMVEIGARWLRHECSVWQEHLASNMVRQKLFAVLQSQPTPVLSSPQVAVTCAPAEEHELGLLILTLLLKRQGWQTTYLGQRTPLYDLAELARANKPNAMLISVSTVLGLTSLIPLLVAENRPAAPLVFGGRLANLLPPLRDHMPGVWLGEDAAASARALRVFTPRSSFWAPTKRAWSAVMALQARRLKIASEVVSELTKKLASDAERSTYSQHLSFPTLYLIDALSSSLAFDVPELMNLEKEWLKEAMPPRRVAALDLTEHRQAMMLVLAKALSSEDGRTFQRLLSRMDGSE